MKNFWQTKALRVARQVNSARWLEFVAPAAGCCGVVAGCLLLVARREGWSARPVCFASAAVLAAAAGYAFRRMRQRRFTLEDGLVRLDSVLGLHNRLISAAAGVGQWPEPAPRPDAGFRWRWERLAVPPVLGAAFAAGALWLPLPAGTAGGLAKSEPPVAWSQVEAAVEALKHSDVTDADALAAIEQKLDALRGQSPESWYSQSSLEAAAALQEETGHAIAVLERNLSTAGQALASADRTGESGAGIPAEKAASWNEALKEMQTGPLPLNRADLSTLKQCSGGKCSLSAGQMQALQKKLGQHGAACKMALGSLGEALAGARCDGRLDAPQDQPNQRGGGGSTAPLGLRQNPTDAQPGREEALGGKDMQHADLGDTVKVSVGGQKVEPETIPGPAAGGAAPSGGSGGDALWKMAPAPGEEAVLKKYFK